MSGMGKSQGIKGYGGLYWGVYGSFPKLGVPFLGVPIIRNVLFWVLHWGPLILGNYHVGVYIYMYTYIHILFVSPCSVFPVPVAVMRP